MTLIHLLVESREGHDAGNGLADEVGLLLGGDGLIGLQLEQAGDDGEVILGAMADLAVEGFQQFHAAPLGRQQRFFGALALGNILRDPEAAQQLALHVELEVRFSREST